MIIILTIHVSEILSYIRVNLRTVRREVTVTNERVSSTRNVYIRSVRGGRTETYEHTPRYNIIAKNFITLLYYYRFNLPYILLI